MPAFCAEKYITACIDSILLQTYSNFELILVDDGSTDSTALICEKYQKKDCRIKLITQSNEGAASARRKGINLAEGRYITFVDADDVVAPEMLEELLTSIGNADLLTSGCLCEKEDGSIIERFDLIREGSYKTDDEYLMQNMICYEMKPYKDGLLPFIGGKLYKTELLRKAVKKTHDNIRYAEDRELLFNYIMVADLIKIIHKSYYTYKYHGTSIMNSGNMNFMCDLNNLYNALFTEFSGNKYADILISQLQLFISSRLYMVSSQMKFDEKWSIPNGFYLCLGDFKKKRL